MMGTAWIGFQAWTMRRMDALAVRRARGRGLPTHLATGERGEREALFHLRKSGYTIVARRWKSAKLWGDIDLVGWDGEWLCFVEVKTRSWAGCDDRGGGCGQREAGYVAADGACLSERISGEAEEGCAGTVRCGVGILAANWS